MNTLNPDTIRHLCGFLAAKDSKSLALTCRIMWKVQKSLRFPLIVYNLTGYWGWRHEPPKHDLNTVRVAIANKKAIPCNLQKIVQAILRNNLHHVLATLFEYLEKNGLDKSAFYRSSCLMHHTLNLCSPNDCFLLVLKHLPCEYYSAWMLETSLQRKNYEISREILEEFSDKKWDLESFATRKLLPDDILETLVQTVKEPLKVLERALHLLRPRTIRQIFESWRIVGYDFNAALENVLRKHKTRKISGHRRYTNWQETIDALVELGANLQYTTYHDHWRSFGWKYCNTPTPTFAQIIDAIKKNKVR